MAPRTATIDIVRAIDDPKLFATAFRDPNTWRAWRAFLAVLFGLRTTHDQRELYARCTGREFLPNQPFNEAWLICGRRAGKSFTLALIAVFLACFKDYRKHLAVGEVATIMIMARHDNEKD